MLRTSWFISYTTIIPTYFYSPIMQVNVCVCVSGNVVHISADYISLQYMTMDLTILFFVLTAIHRLDALNLMVHAFNSVFMVIDLFLAAHPFRLLHCYWPFFITVCYVVFSYIYYESGGTDRQDRPFVYPLLDWRMPKRTAASSVFGLVFVLTVHCIAWFLFLIRKWIAVFIKQRHSLPTYQEKNYTSSEIQPALQIHGTICWLN
jgi:hypothetical protein